MQKILILLVMAVTSLSGQTQVVNIANDSCDVYIGRGIDKYITLLSEDIEPGIEGWLGNPHHIGWCQICNEHHTRDECISKFTLDFHKKLASDESFHHAVRMLKGKTLGCYCKPENCHGDIIKKWLDETD